MARKYDSVSKTSSTSRGKRTWTKTKTWTDKRGERHTKTSTFSFNIFGFVAIIMLLYVLVPHLVSFIENPDIVPDFSFSFSSFLDMLKNVPEVSLSWLNGFTSSIDLPAWLNWLEPVFDFLTNILAVLGFVFTAAIQAMNFVLYFLRYLFW